MSALYSIPGRKPKPVVEVAALPLGSSRLALGRVGLALAMAVALLLSACRSDPPTITPGAAGESEGAPQPPAGAGQISVEVRNSELALGLERFSFLLRDENGNLIRDGSVQINFQRVNPATGERSPGAHGEALYFGQGMPDGGGWIAYTEFDTSGPWALDVTARRPSGWTGAASVEVEVDGRTTTPRVGMAPPATDGPRLTEGVDIASLTSDSVPLESLYRTSLADALASGQPSVVVLASPAHCDADTCRVTLQSAKALAGTYSGRVQFLHFESRDLASPEQPSAAAETWGIQTEPWVFVIDNKGFVHARIEGGVDSTELDLLIRRALGESVTRPQP